MFLKAQSVKIAKVIRRKDTHLYRRLTYWTGIAGLAGLMVLCDLPAPFVGDDGSAFAQERSGGFFQRLFGRRKKEELQQIPQTPQQEKTVPDKASSADAEARKKQATAPLPKIEDANRIVVIGDITANAIAEGLIESYKRTPSVEISAKIEQSLSVTGDRLYPWLDASDFNFLGERVRAVVVALGTNDRAPIATPPETAQFGTADWKRAYSRRLLDISAQLQLLSVPIIWVMPPPVIDDEHSEMSAEIGAIQSQVLQPFNFRAVDLMDGFVDREGKYSAVGANISGERVSLRLDDGIGFTKSGRGKLAYYVRREIDEILDDLADQGLKLEKGTEPKRSAQQVVILTRPALLQGAVLAGGNGRASAFYRDQKARDFFVGGKPAAPRKGRIDDYAWSASETRQASTPPQSRPQQEAGGER